MIKTAIACLVFTIIWLIIIPWAVAGPIMDVQLPIGNHYFTSEDCSACQLQAPIIQKLEKQGYIFYTYTYKTDKKMFEKYNIKVVPYFMIVKSKNEVLELKGQISYKTLRTILYKNESDIARIIKRIKKLIEKGR